MYIGNCRFLVRVSYLEIYNEEVRDLLGKDQNQKLEVCLSNAIFTPDICILLNKFDINTPPILHFMAMLALWLITRHRYQFTTFNFGYISVV